MRRSLFIFLAVSLVVPLFSYAPLANAQSASCVILTSNLSRGSTGTEVVRLQQFLISQGLLSSDSATGTFGPLTEVAVQRWQSAHNIVSSGSPNTTGYGSVGPSTRAAMARCGTTPPPNTCPVVQQPSCTGTLQPIKDGNNCTVQWQCVPGIPAETFNAAPIRGAAPLTVTFNGIVNSNDAGFCLGTSCTSTIDFGDGTTGGVPLPTTVNTALTYSQSHTYPNPGTFTAVFYQGPSGSNKIIGRQVLNAEAPIPANVSVLTTSSTVKNGTPLAVTWSGENAPAGSTATLSLIDASTGEILGWISKNQPASGTLNWNGSFTDVDEAHSIYDPSVNGCNNGTCRQFKVRVSIRPDKFCSEQYREVQVTCSPGTTSSLYAAANSRTLTIGQSSTSLTVTSPSGGSFSRLSSIPITWTATGTLPTSGTVTFGLFANNTPVTDRTSIATSDAIAGGTTQWTIPADMPLGTYTIHATVSSGGVTTVPSAAFNVVEALAPTIRITAPGGERAVAQGSPLNISWQSTNAPQGAAVVLWLVKISQGVSYPIGIVGRGLGQSSSTSVIIPARVPPACADCTGIRTAVGPGTYVVTAHMYTPSDAWLGDGYPPANPKTPTYLVSATSSLFTVTSSSGAIDPCTALTHTMFPGDTDANTDGDVSRLQEFLAQSPDIYPEGTVSGFYGPATTAAVQRYQTSRGLVSAGTPSTTGFGAIGAKTRESMACKPIIVTSGDVTLKITAPSADQVFTANDPISVTWQSANAPLNAVVALTMYRKNGTLLTAIPGSFTGSGVSSTTQMTAASVPGSYVIGAQLTVPPSTTLASATSSVFLIRGASGSTEPCLALSHSMSRGDSDATTDGEVTVLQQFLAQDPSIYPEASVSGFYGPATERAVQRWQAAHGVVSSGSPETTGYGAIGAKTRTAMGANCNQSGGLTATPTVGTAPLAVTFTQVSGTTITFGDGQTNTSVDASSKTASHTYTRPGTYIARSGNDSVTVTVKDAGSAITCASISHNLAPDDTDATTGGDVTKLQQFLIDNGLLSGEATGFYGPMTVTAVQRWQAAHNIVSSGTPASTGYGRVGSATRTAMACNQSNSIFSATPKSGSAPLAVNFTARVDRTSNDYGVDFGDGVSQVFSCDQLTTCPFQWTASHTYAVSGTYNAKLKRFDGFTGTVGSSACGSDTVCAALEGIANTVGSSTIATVPIIVGTGVTTPTSCPTGQVLSGSQCVAITCPTGQVLSGSQCVTPTPTSACIDTGSVTFTGGQPGGAGMHLHGDVLTTDDVARVQLANSSGQTTADITAETYSAGGKRVWIAYLGTGATPVPTAGTYTMTLSNSSGRVVYRQKVIITSTATATVTACTDTGTAAATGTATIEAYSTGGLSGRGTPGSVIKIAVLDRWGSQISVNSNLDVLSPSGWWHYTVALSEYSDYTVNLYDRSGVLLATKTFNVPPGTSYYTAPQGGL